MQQELAEVRNAVKHLTRAQAAISYKWADGASSPTPPGHWNFIADTYIERANFSEVRAARALALVNMALHDAAIACWDTKYTYFNPRPTQLDPKLRTAIALPNCPSYESGHSVFSGAAAGRSATCPFAALRAGAAGAAGVPTPAGIGVNIVRNTAVSGGKMT